MLYQLSYRGEAAGDSTVPACGLQACGFLLDGIPHGSGACVSTIIAIIVSVDNRSPVAEAVGLLIHTGSTEFPPDSQFGGLPFGRCCYFVKSSPGSLGADPCMTKWMLVAFFDRSANIVPPVSGCMASVF